MENKKEKEKVVNIKNTEGISMEEYLETPDSNVTRGELVEIIDQVLVNIDKELINSFERVVKTNNLVELVVQALINKDLISMEDIEEVQKTMIEEYEKLKEETENVAGK